MHEEAGYDISDMPIRLPLDMTVKTMELVELIQPVKEVECGVVSLAARIALTAEDNF